MRQSSKTSSPVCDARMPILSSFLPIDMPSALPGTMNEAWPRWPRSGSTVTPLLLCLVAVVFADLAFAIDSIPAAFAITRDPFIIWMGNVFALLGLRALFVLVEGLVRRFRYLDQTIAVVLGAVGVKLAIEDLVHIGPLASLGIIAVLFGAGIVASIIGDKRDPEGAREREENSRVEAPETAAQAK